MRLLLLSAALMVSLPSSADECRTLTTEFTPSEDLQIVVWLETADGEFVETLYITDQTGRYGIGNRPGNMRLNSGWAWPYGRRTTTFPIWAHRHGKTWPKIIFQNEDDDNLSHPLGDSSQENHFCRPIKPTEAMWDTETCASLVRTDKGRFEPNSVSLYPPRLDHTKASVDDADVEMYRAMNPFDAVSRATPEGGKATAWPWKIPDTVADGEYVVWFEVSKEFDQNEHYDYPALQGIPWAQYGLPYRGQPSVVYKLPLEISPTAQTFSTLDYYGYGDPEGEDGTVRPPDETISTDTAGSGASRIHLSERDGNMFRISVITKQIMASERPTQIDQVSIADVDANVASISFVEPANGLNGIEVRYLAGETIDETNWENATPASEILQSQGEGAIHTLTVEGLLPQTTYAFGLRTLDDCLNGSDIKVLQVSTPRPPTGTVDACFVATAAHGSKNASDVVELRHFRDQLLRKSVLGEVLTVSYYAMGPSAAATITYHPSLKELARQSLAPMVNASKNFRAKGKRLFSFFGI